MTDPARPLAYSTHEAAAALMISKSLLKRAMSHSLVRYVRVGNVLRIPAAEVERIAAEGMPKVPRNYVRRTQGPVRGGSPRKKV